MVAFSWDSDDGLAGGIDCLRAGWVNLMDLQGVVEASQGFDPAQPFHDLE